MKTYEDKTCLEIRARNFTPKTGHFGFSYLIKNYAEDTKSITDIIISK